MALALTPREKKLLAGCVASLLIVAGMLGTNEFLTRRRAVQEKITALTTELDEHKSWFSDREFWDKRAQWLNANMPVTESLGQASAMLLEDIENDALDLELQVVKKRLLEPANTENYNEVAVEVTMRGDQTTLLGWLASLQSPERFQAIKAMEFELDTRAKEKTPQAFCNLTLARWFKPEGGL
jgi:hypothetical protein